MHPFIPPWRICKRLRSSTAVIRNGSRSSWGVIKNGFRPHWRLSVGSEAILFLGICGELWKQLGDLEILQPSVARSLAQRFWRVKAEIPLFATQVFSQYAVKRCVSCARSYSEWNSSFCFGLLFEELLTLQYGQPLCGASLATLVTFFGCNALEYL